MGSEVSVAFSSGVPALFFRGSIVVRREMLSSAPEYYPIPIAEPVKWEGQAYDPHSKITCAIEMYKRAEFDCPNCHCVIYNSQNYMELPEWAREPMAVSR